MKMGKLIIILVITGVLGLGTGYLLSRTSGKIGSIVVAPRGSASQGTVEGSNDAAFKDTVEGVLKEGGIEDEGQFHLVRPGGDSQNVYMTSSIVDLSKYLDKKIKVWGQTQKARKAGWLMDVGRVEVLN